jgi:hypothetical protein
MERLVVSIERFHCTLNSSSGGGGGGGGGGQNKNSLAFYFFFSRLKHSWKYYNDAGCGPCIQIVTAYIAR